MKKGIYLFGDVANPVPNDKSIGIYKKIISQVETFKDVGIDFEAKNLSPSGSFARRVASLFLGTTFSEFNLDFSSYDIVYFRRIHPNCPSVENLLRQIKEQNAACKIIYEIPTYPYEKEHKGLSGKVSLAMDKFYRRRLKKYVDKIATLTDDDEIFGIPTIRFYNGVQVAKIPAIKSESLSDEINLIAVAQFAFWHGYERIISGMSDYYKNGGDRKLVLHLVGNGSALDEYKKIVEEKGLEDCVKFYGALSGDGLTNIFEKCDLAIGSLAGHKKDIFISSELKSREYMARGLPMISSTKIDVFPEHFEFCHYVPANESNIDIKEIIEFRDKIYSGKTRQTVVAEIRKFADENCDMTKTMKPIIDWMVGE